MAQKPGSSPNPCSACYEAFTTAALDIWLGWSIRRTMMALGSSRRRKQQGRQPVCSPSRNMSSNEWTLSSPLFGRVIYTGSAKNPMPPKLPRTTQSGGQHMHPYRHFRHSLSPIWMPPSRLQPLLSHSQPRADARHDTSTWWSRYHDRSLFYLWATSPFPPIPFCFYAVDASVLVFLSRQNATPQMEFSCHMTVFFYSRKGAFWSHGAKGFYLRGIHLV